VEVGAAFSNDLITATEDRNLYLDRITIEPPPGVADPVQISAEAMTGEYERREQRFCRRARRISKNIARRKLL